MTYLDIWNEAYNIYTDAGRSEGQQYNDMQKFLSDRVKDGSITALDKCYIARDVMATAGL